MRMKIRWNKQSQKCYMVSGQQLHKGQTLFGDAGCDFVSAGRTSDPAGIALELAGKALKPTGRALKTMRISDPESLRSSWVGLNESTIVVSTTQAEHFRIHSISWEGFGVSLRGSH